jgi:spore coat protein U-like protein
MKSAKLLLGLATLGVLLIGLGGASQAADKTADLDVSASIAKNCTITTAPVNFPTYDPIVTHASAPDDGTGTVTVACTKGAAVTVALGQGDNYSGGNRMANGTNYLGYALYQDSGYSAAWGTGSGNEVLVTTTSKDPVPLTVYGRIPGGQDLPEGTYNDTVVATVNF